MLQTNQMPRCLACLAVILAVAGGAPARAETVLRWKFKPGETLHYATHQKMIQRINVGPAPITMTINQIMEMSWAVKSVEAGGVASVTQTIDRIQMKMESPQGITIDYDSASDKEPDGLAKMITPVFKAIVKKPISLKVNPRGEVSDVQLPQGMIDGLNNMPGMESIGGMLSEEGIKRMAGMGGFPEGAVSAGDTWNRAVEIAVPMIGKAKTDTKYEYLGSETRNGKQLEKILVTMQMDFGAGEKQAALALKIKEQEYKGTTYFDNATGRVVETLIKGKTKMAVTMGDTAVEMDMEMDLQMKLEPTGPSPESTPKE